MKLLNFIIMFFYVYARKGKQNQLIASIYAASAPIGLILLSSIAFVLQFIVEKNTITPATYGISVMVIMYLVDKWLNNVYRGREDYIELIFKTYSDIFIVKLILVILGIFLYLISILFFAKSFTFV